MNGRLHHYNGYFVFYDYLILAYSGCFPETPTARQLAVNPGNYVPGSLTPTECELSCSKKGQILAGLTAGNVCFCGMATTQPQAADSACVETCAGDATQKCGTNAEPPYDSVYTSPVDLSGFQIFPGGRVLQYKCCWDLKFHNLRKIYLYLLNFVDDYQLIVYLYICILYDVRVLYLMQFH